MKLTDQKLINELQHAGFDNAAHRLEELSETLLKAKIAAAKSLKYSTVYGSRAWPVYEALGIRRVND